MARPLRIEFAGALYHVTSRGDRREPIFEDDEDRVKFLGVLAEVANLTPCSVCGRDACVSAYADYLDDRAACAV